MKLLISCILLSYLFVFELNAQQIPKIEIVATEYPPFTSSFSSDGGIAFQLLNAKFSNKEFDIVPLILPPARAGKVLDDNQWCASFYPPLQSKGIDKLVLGRQNVKIGLIRKKKEDIFSWQSLGELSGRSVSLLRTNKSRFTQKFIDSGLQVTEVESIDAALNMLLLDRVDLAMIDNVTFESLENEVKNSLQLSQTSLFETPVMLYINTQCEYASWLLQGKK